MRVLPPLSINDSLLTSSTISEPSTFTSEVVWVSGTVYNVGDKVILVSTHRQYQRLTNGSGSTTPDLAPTIWADIGPTNKYAMFDLLRNSASSASTSMTIVITPGKRVDSIALMMLDADTVTITMTSSAVNVYTYTENLSTRNTLTWSDYYFGAFTYKASLIRFDLPPYMNGVITVVISKASGTVSCGACCIGNQIDLGQTQYQASSDALNFSVVNRDAFGGAVLVPRRSVPKTDQTVLAPKATINRVREARSILNAQPAVWAGIDDSNDQYFEALLILGIYKEFSINLDFPDYAKVSLQLEEI